jgi:hypothetical protein
MHLALAFEDIGSAKLRAKLSVTPRPLDYLNLSAAPEPIAIPAAVTRRVDATAQWSLLDAAPNNHTVSPGSNG